MKHSANIYLGELLKKLKNVIGERLDRNIFQNAVLVLFVWGDREKLLKKPPKVLDLSNIYVNFQKVLTKNDVTVANNWRVLNIKSRKDVIMASNYGISQNFRVQSKDGFWYANQLP